jgi:hypothetical protein
MCSSSRSWPPKLNRDTGKALGRGFTVVVAPDRASQHPGVDCVPWLEQSLRTGQSSRRLAPSRHTGLTRQNPYRDDALPPLGFDHVSMRMVEAFFRPSLGRHAVAANLMA